MRFTVSTSFVSLVAAGFVLVAACKTKPALTTSETTAAAASSDPKKPASELFDDPSGTPDLAPGVADDPKMTALANLDGGVRVDEAFFAKYIGAMGDQLERDAKPAAKRKFKDVEEALS